MPAMQVRFAGRRSHDFANLQLLSRRREVWNDQNILLRQSLNSTSP